MSFLEKGDNYELVLNLHTIAGGYNTHRTSEIATYLLDREGTIISSEYDGTICSN